MFRRVTFSSLILLTPTLLGCGPKAEETTSKESARQTETEATKPTAETTIKEANEKEAKEKEANEKEANEKKAAGLQPVDLGAAKPAHVINQVYMSGQPDEKDMPQLKSKGIKTVVSLRTDGEVNFDEKSSVEAAGMKYVNIPFQGDDQLTDEVFDQVRDVLKDKQDQPVLLHCGSSNRVGAVWLAHRVLDDGLGIDEALQEAKTAGLRSEGYQKKAEEYIKRNEK